MTRLLLKKTLVESALLFLACAILLYAFCWARVWIVCQFDLEQFAPLLKQFKRFEKFAPVPLEQFLTYAGSIAMSFSEPMLILCIVVWAISRGSDVVSGEVNRGTMEMLLGQPISRTRLLFSHAAVCTLGLASLCGIAWLGILTGIAVNTVTETVVPEVQVKVPYLPIEIPMSLGEATVVETPLASKVSPWLYIAPTLNLFGFGFLILAFSSMLSCFDRYRWRTIGLTLGAYVVQFLLFLLSRATSVTGWCGYLSFFSLYQPDGVVQLVKSEPYAVFHLFTQTQVVGWPYWLGPLGMTMVLIGLGCCCYAIGWWRFVNRDLPAPL